MKTLFALLLILTAGTTLANSDPVTAEIESADGVKIHAESWGKGDTPLVFVHGWSCDSSYWRDQVKDLALDYRVVAIDLAGHGQSESGREHYTMQAFGQDVAAVLEAWDLKSATLIGHSMGGAVITEAALAAPDRVLGLIGIDNFQNANLKLEPEQIDGFTSGFKSDMQGVTTKWVRSMFPDGADSNLVAEISNDMAAAPPEVALSCLDELLHWYGASGTESLAALKVPLMCINSDAIPTDEAAMKALVPRYQARYLTNVGHFLFRENPLAFNNILRQTLAEIMPK